MDRVQLLATRRAVLPPEVVSIVAEFWPLDRLERGAFVNAIAFYTRTEDAWNPEDFLVYSFLGESLRIPVAHQPWRTELVFDHVFRPQAGLRARELLG